MILMTQSILYYAGSVDSPLDATPMTQSPPCGFFSSALKISIGSSLSPGLFADGFHNVVLITSAHDLVLTSSLHERVPICFPKVLTYCIPFDQNIYCGLHDRPHNTVESHCL